MGVVGAASSSPQPATVAQARIRPEKEINLSIGNPILLDKIAGLSKGLIGMKVFAVALSLSLVLAAAPSFAQAQAPAPAQPATGTKPAPAQPAPTTAKPAPAAAQPQAPPKVPFQTGLKYAYVQ